MSLRVLVADDERLVRAGLRMVLSADPGIEVVGEAEDGVQAVEAARRLGVDVVLMDLRMPRLDGVAATRALCAGPPPRPRVVVVTTFLEDETVVDALRAGASGYVLKDAPEEHLLAAVHGAEGAALLDARAVAALLAREPKTAPPVGLEQLTAREVEVLGLLAEGLSNTQLARRLNLGETTVKTHVARVLEKLGLESRAQAVVAAYESGLVRPGGS